MPIASTRPNSVSRLIEKPSTCIPEKAPMTETGTATTGIKVARQLCRKTNTTSVTSSSASNSVFTTSLMEAVTYGVVSNAIDQCTPAGKLLASSVMRATTSRFTSRALAPGRRNTGVRAVGVPSNRPARS